MRELRREVKIKRGCGYRVVGGLYLVSDRPMHGCGLLPRELTVCPCCHAGIKQKIGWTWVQARMVLQSEDVKGCDVCNRQMSICAMPGLAGNLEAKLGLIWIGAQHYPDPQQFIQEAVGMGISRRIHALPNGFIVGVTWVLLAHSKACPPRLDLECAVCNGDGMMLHPKIALQLEVHVGPVEQTPAGVAATLGVPVHVPCKVCSNKRPGIFGLFRPQRIEQIITESQARNEEMLSRLEERGITPVVVPDDDPDHRGRAEAQPQYPENNQQRLAEIAAA